MKISERIDKIVSAGTMTKPLYAGGLTADSDEKEVVGVVVFKTRKGTSVAVIFGIEKITTIEKTVIIVEADSTIKDTEHVFVKIVETQKKLLLELAKKVVKPKKTYIEVDMTKPEH